MAKKQKQPEDCECTVIAGVPGQNGLEGGQQEPDVEEEYVGELAVGV